MHARLCFCFCRDSASSGGPQGLQVAWLCRDSASSGGRQGLEFQVIDDGAFEYLNHTLSASAGLLLCALLHLHAERGAAAAVDAPLHVDRVDRRLARDASREHQVVHQNRNIRRVRGDHTFALAASQR